MRLLREWLSPVQRMQFAKNEYFEVVGGDTGRRYRIYPGTMSNVFEIDETGHPRLGLCFRTTGELPIGDVMLAQKIGLENCEGSVLALARSFVPGIFMFRRGRLLG